MTMAVHDGSERLKRVRRASLRAVARVHGGSEPTDRECDDATWQGGLAGAYRSLPGRSVALVAASPDGADLPAVPAPILRRPPFALAFAAGAAAFALALATSPSAAFWETRGHLPIERWLGVPGAPDSLLYAALARAWTLLLSPVASLDVALSLFTLASLSALAAAAFLLLQSVLRRAPGARWWSSAGSVVLVTFGTWLLVSRGWLTPSATGGLLSAAAASAAIWLALRCVESRRDVHSARRLLAGSYFALLAISGVSVWLLPVGSLLLLALSTRTHQSF